MLQDDLRRHGTFPENRFLAVEVCVDLPPQTTEDFGERLCPGMCIRIGVEAIKLCDQGHMLTIN
jgi:hypothetical protein